jgi:hypothetical protein
MKRVKVKVTPHDAEPIRAYVKVLPADAQFIQSRWATGKRKPPVFSNVRNEGMSFKEQEAQRMWYRAWGNLERAYRRLNSYANRPEHYADGEAMKKTQPKTLKKIMAKLERINIGERP